MERYAFCTELRKLIAQIEDGLGSGDAGNELQLLLAALDDAYDSGEGGW